MSLTRIDILTLFPKMFTDFMRESIIGRAIKQGIVKIAIHDIRKYTFDKHKTVDSRPFGGGTGMVLMPEPIFLALEDILQYQNICKREKYEKNTCIILLSPKGKVFSQNNAKLLTKYERLVFICGHYEGFDERIRSIADCELSIGDYVLTCGELPAMVIADSIIRLIPGVLGGGEEAIMQESFEDSLLESPHYTRPAIFRNMETPAILRSGDHKKIDEWRQKESENITKSRRPDLYLKYKEAKGHASRSK